MYLPHGLSSVLEIHSQILSPGLSRLVIPNLFFLCVFALAIGKSVTSGGNERLSFQNYLLSSHDRQVLRGRLGTARETKRSKTRDPEKAHSSKRRITQIHLALYRGRKLL